MKNFNKVGLVCTLFVLSFYSFISAEEAKEEERRYNVVVDATPYKVGLFPFYTEFFLAADKTPLKNETADYRAERLDDKIYVFKKERHGAKDIQQITVRELLEKGKVEFVYTDPGKIYDSIYMITVGSKYYEGTYVLDVKIDKIDKKNKLEKDKTSF